MFTMAKIKDGGRYLERHLSSNDYYCEGEKVIGLWQGRAAERLGLCGEIHADDPSFECLRQNQRPDGKGKLTARDCDHRVRFFDFQCSAQKSVSIMAVTVGDTRLLEAHDHAAAVGFRELEKFSTCQTNTLLERRNRVTGNVIAATFRHTASRALDPQVHTHFVVANATWDEQTKSWKALNEYEMVRAIRYAGKVYQNELARSCRALGYEITTAHDRRGTITGFEIAGVSDEIRARFSKRRAEIECGIAAFEREYGRTPTTVEVHAIAVGSRDAKLAEVTTPEVLAAQRRQLTPGEWSHLSELKATAQELGRKGPETTRERESLRLSVGHLYERRSVIPGHEIMAEALNQNLGLLDLERLHGQAAKAKLVALDGKKWLHGTFATPRGLAQERWAVEFIARTNKRFPELGRPDASAMEGLSLCQRKAVAEVLRSPDQVVCLRGAAGVGKTTVLRAIHASLSGENRPILTCAPTSSAADTLRSDGIPNATTVTGLLQNAAPSEIPNGVVLIVDEAGLSSNQQGAELLQLAERHEARIIFLGDSRQHTSVEAGDFLRILETHSPLHRVELTEIRRQTVTQYREAVGLMAAGSSREGLIRLDELGWVHEGNAEYLAAAVKDYLCISENGQHMDRVLAVTPSWDENRAFTAMLRAELKKRGGLGLGAMIDVHEPLLWTKAQLARAENYVPGFVVTFNKGTPGFKRGDFAEVLRIEGDQVWVAGRSTEQPLKLDSGAFTVAKVGSMEVCPGDKLLIRANDRGARLINGQTLSVTAVKDGAIHTAEGKRIDTSKFKQLTYGFAVTSHRSQSKTVDHVVVAASQFSSKSAYVACSRGRLSCSVHTPDKTSLLDRLPEGTRPAVFDSKTFVTPIREKLWSRRGQGRGDALERSSVALSALSKPWWRGLMHNLARWSNRALVGNRVDVGNEIEGPQRSHP